MRTVTHSKQIRWERKEFCHCSRSQFLKRLSRSLSKVTDWSLTKFLFYICAPSVVWQELETSWLAKGFISRSLETFIFHNCASVSWPYLRSVGSLSRDFEWGRDLCSFCEWQVGACDGGVHSCACMCVHIRVQLRTYRGLYVLSSVLEKLRRRQVWGVTFDLRKGEKWV